MNYYFFSFNNLPRRRLNDQPIYCLRIATLHSQPTPYTIWFIYVYIATQLYLSKQLKRPGNIYIYMNSLSAPPSYLDCSKTIHHINSTWQTFTFKRKFILRYTYIFYLYLYIRRYIHIYISTLIKLNLHIYNIDYE